MCLALPEKAYNLQNMAINFGMNQMNMVISPGL